MSTPKYNTHISTHVWIAYNECGCVVGVADDIPMNGADIWSMDQER